MSIWLWLYLVPSALMLLSMPSLYVYAKSKNIDWLSCDESFIDGRRHDTLAFLGWTGGYSWALLAFIWPLAIPIAACYTTTFRKLFMPLIKAIYGLISLPFTLLALPGKLIANKGLVSNTITDKIIDQEAMEEVEAILNPAAKVRYLPGEVIPGMEEKLLECVHCHCKFWGATARTGAFFCSCRDKKGQPLPGCAGDCKKGRCY